MKVENKQRITHDCHHNHDDDDDGHRELNSKDIYTRFYIDQVLGRGAFATVYKARVKKQSAETTYSNYQRNNDCSRQMKECSCCNGSKNYHHTTDLSLKIVNVTRVINRRRARKFMDKQCHEKGAEKSHEHHLLSSEYDTDELFFPSRIMKKNQVMNREDEKDAEQITITKIISREVSVHLNISRLNHPNIVRMLESFQYNISGSGSLSRDLIVAMVMEYCPFGDLQHYLKRRKDDRQSLMETNGNRMHQEGMVPTLLDEREIQHAMRHILRGLAFLHSHGIVHRDIKAGNILLSISAMSNYSNKRCIDDGGCTLSEASFNLFDCCLKLGDFGLAAQMSDEDDWDEAQYTICGTPSFLAPEVALSTPIPASKCDIPVQQGELLQDKLFTNNRCFAQQDIVFGDVRGHGQPADLWSVGCLLYIMLVGRYPFSRTNRHPDFQNRLNEKHMKIKETLDKIISGNWNIPQNVSMSAMASNLLSQLLCMDPKSRGFARGILSTHSFFKDVKGDEFHLCDNSSNSTCNSFHTSGIAKSHEYGSDQNGVTVNQSGVENRGEQFALKSTNDVCCDKILLHENDRPEDRPNKQKDSLVKLKQKSSLNDFKSPKTFIKPIENIHALLPTKYQWETITKPRKFKSKEQKLSFSLFILPDKRGIVFQCEKDDSGRGAWMHLAGDGERICLGKLSKSPNLLRFHENIDGDCRLLNEAFSCRPKKFKTLNTTTYGTIAAKNDNQSMYTMTPLCDTTVYSTPSTNSLPLQANDTIPQTKYKRIACLLQQHNRVFLSLYRKLGKVVKKLKEKTPRISLSIHECDTDNDEAGKILCTVASFSDPKPIIITTFVDGFKVIYDRSTGFADISGFQQDNHLKSSLSVHLQSNIIKIKSQENDNEIKDCTGSNIVGAYFSYLQFARSAIKKCVAIEQEVYGKETAIQRSFVIKGKSFRSWIDVTKRYRCIDEKENEVQRVMTGKILSRSLIDDIHETSLSLLGRNIR